MNIYLHPGEERTLAAVQPQHDALHIDLAPHSRFTLLVQRDEPHDVSYSIDFQQDSYCRIIYLSHLAKKNQKNTANQKIIVNFVGSNAVCEYFGLCNVAENAEVQANVEVFHNAGNCTSRQVFKAIADNDARVCFDGKIVVARDAQKTNASQTSKGILLSNTAHIVAQPQLEIYADDVKCSHGAAVGQLDAEALFYLRSRGIDQPQARQMLLQAFAQEILDLIDN
ncbi:hypothetical protein FACS189452_02960 [Bacteroidia bacterium]|nr:hypothetical protein FACS189452_02960 [Bacteroidia bacterium]GHT81698.1 hypothetical protein FACS189467_6200 [Bacteroidia bacterium]